METEPPDPYPWKIIVRTLEKERKTFRATAALLQQAIASEGHCIEIHLPGFQRRSTIQFCLRGDKTAYFREIGLERPAKKEDPEPMPPTG